MPFSLNNIKPAVIVSIALTSLLVIGLVGLIILRYRPGTTSSPQPSARIVEPSIPPITGAKIPRGQNFQDQLTKLLPYLPYEESAFSIQYTEQLNTVRVIVNANTREQFLETKKRAESFVKAKGVDDICALKIFWQTPDKSQLYKSLNPLDYLTSGCSSIN